MNRPSTTGFPRLLALSALVLAAGCGGDAAEAAPEDVSAETPRTPVAEQRTSDVDARAPDPAGSDSSATTDPAAYAGPAGRQEPPVLTEPPDACTLLTRADAAELLGAPVGPGRSADVSGLGNCAYRTEAGEQLSLVVQLGADDRVASTQFAMSLEHCGTRLVSQPEDLGVASTLFERPSEPCAAALVLWVATGRRFEGRTHPELVRTVSGRIHLLVTRSPAPSPGDALPVLRAVAERAQRRLEE